MGRAMTAAAGALVADVGQALAHEGLPEGQADAVAAALFRLAATWRPEGQVGQAT